jgi:hypothetical protein
MVQVRNSYVIMVLMIVMVTNTGCHDDNLYSSHVVEIEDKAYIKKGDPGVPFRFVMLPEFNVSSDQQQQQPAYKWTFVINYSLQLVN